MRIIRAIQLTIIHSGTYLTPFTPVELPPPELPKKKSKNHQKSRTKAFATPERSKASHLLNTGSNDKQSSPSLLTADDSTKKRALSEIVSPPLHLNTEYYIALWGSQYDLQSSSRLSGTEHRRHTSDTGTEGSPLASRNRRGAAAQLRGGASLIQRSNTDNLVPAGRETSPLSKPTYDLTGDWIREYHRVRVERKTWLSDGSDNSTDSLSESSEGKDWPEYNLPTPRVIARGRLDTTRLSHSMIEGATDKHRHLSSTATLTQKEFDDIQQKSDERQSRATNMLASLMSGGLTRRERRNTGSISEKPLPAAPVNETISEVSLCENQVSSFSSLRRQRVSASGTAAFQRPKKKVMWKGKICTIALPLDDVRDELGQLKIPLTDGQAAERLAQWERSSISIRGFDHIECYPSDSLSGQSCDIYPDSSSIHPDPNTSNKPIVKIPNKQLWDDYVRQLQEEKLRALGVTLPDEELPARTSSVLSHKTTQSSLHSPFPQASAGLSLSANGFGSPIDQMISPPGSAPTTQFPFPPAMISPIMQPVMPRSAGLHMANHSIAFNRDRAFSPHNSSSYASFIPGQQYLGSMPSSRGISPLVDDGKQFIRSTQSPLLSVPDVLRNGYAQGQLDFPVHAPQQGRFSPTFEPSLPVSLQRQASEKLYQQTPVQYVSQPEIASPLPQGRSHRHNVSESLQREIDEAERDFETSIGQQLQDADPAGRETARSTVNTSSRLSTSAAINPRTLPKKSMSIVSDIETNPSQTSSPQLSASHLGSNAYHGSKQSVPKLNVNAQAFVFNPGRSSPAAPMFTFEDKPPARPQITTSNSLEGSHSKNTSTGPTFGTRLNVAAPAFIPGQPVERLSNQILNFSSKSPGLKPDAPAFKPGLIFGELNGRGLNNMPKAVHVFSHGDMIQLPKKSKAIPIIPPKADDDAQEDEEGRITRGEGRLKRTRRGGGSGDQVPLFATPSDDVPATITVHSKPDVGFKNIEQKSVIAIESLSHQAPAQQTKSFTSGEPEPKDDREIGNKSKQMTDQVVPAALEKIEGKPGVEQPSSEDNAEIARFADADVRNSVAADSLEGSAVSTADAANDKAQPVLNAKDINHEKPESIISHHIDDTTDVKHDAGEGNSGSGSTEIANTKLNGLPIQNPLQTISISPVYGVDPCLNTADLSATPAKMDSPLDDLMYKGDLAPTDASKLGGVTRIPNNLEDTFTLGDHEDDNHTNKSIIEQQSTPVKEEMVQKITSIEHSDPDVAYDTIDMRSATPIGIKPSNLSAKAKPFVFNPSTAVFNPEPLIRSSLAPTKLVEPHLSQFNTSAPQHAPPHPAIDLVTIASQQTASKKPVFSVGLGASRYATEEPTSPLEQPLSIPKSPPPELSNEQAPIQTMQSSSPLFQPAKSVKQYQDRVASPELSPLASDSRKSVSEKGHSPSITPTQAPIAERIASGVQYVEPSFKEIDDVMKQLNGDDSDLGVERNPPQVWKSPREEQRDRAAMSDRNASPSSELLKASPAGIPSSSANNLDRPFQYLPRQDYGSSDSEDSRLRDAEAEMIACNARYSPSFKKPDHSVDEEQDEPVYRPNRNTSGSISNWDDFVSDNEVVDFQDRMGFFDNRVGHVISNAMNDRLQPIESTLAELTAAISRLNNRSRSSRPHPGRSVESDADDEDDDDEEAIGAMRAISPFMKDRRFENLRSILLYALGQRQTPNNEIREVLENVAELKTVIQTQKSALRSEGSASGFSTNDLATLNNTIAALQTSLSPQNMKTLMDNLIKKHIVDDSIAAKPSQVTASGEKLHIRIAVLEDMVKNAEGRADEEYRLHRRVEDSLAQSERELKAAIAEATLQRKTSENSERNLNSLLDEFKESKIHAGMLEEAKSALENDLSDAQDKTLALEETIAEYRISHDKWREDVDAATAENQELSQIAASLRNQLEGDMMSRQVLKEKFERVQQEMIAATKNIARDQAAWRHRDEEHKARHELSSARLEAEARTRERLELEIERLEKQEREAMKARTLVEDIRSQNGNLTDMVNELRSKAHKFQEQALTMERELHDAKERSRLEIQRIIGVTENDTQIANQQAQLVRTNLEGVVQRLEDQISYLLSDAKSTKEGHQAMLEDASISRGTALREAAEAREAALQEHYRFHERTIRETQMSHERALSELKADHSRAFAITHNEQQRTISNLQEDHKRVLVSGEQGKRIAAQETDGRFALSNDTILHLQNKVLHLEERLTIASSAAQAAALAAHVARNSLLSSPAGRTTDPSLRGFDPQALRQTVETLQDQLGERERQIEDLQQELDNVDKEAPSKVKERDAEITWLRELLGVRMDDMQDVLVQLSTPHFDRIAIRDAVIRLRASLQMEQQERERQLAGEAKFPSLSEIKASPKSLPLAAAAAWGNWRKGQSSLSSLAEMAVPSASSSAAQTPSKSSPQSFLSGLLTPPSTNIRQTPRTRGSLSRSNASPQRPLSGFSTPKRQITIDYNAKPRNDAPEEIPETPVLLTHGTYDADAPEGSHHYSLEQYLNKQEDLPSEDNSQQGDDDSLTFITSGESSDKSANPFSPSIELAG